MANIPWLNHDHEDAPIDKSRLPLNSARLCIVGGPSRSE